MAPERQPWYKHYPADWRGDAHLRLCSLAARGLWTECLGLMHEAEPRGYLLHSLDELARLVGRPMREVRVALMELEHRGVPSRDDLGRLYSRRMVRDTARSLTLTENGRRGGNPAILVKGLVNQEDEVLVKPLVNSAGARTHATTEHLGTEALSLIVRTKELSTSLVQDRFQTFWDAYPNKIKRKAALALFTALQPDADLLARMLDAIAAWKLSRHWREGYVPHATTWLRGEQWADEVPPEPVVTGPMTRGERAEQVTRDGLAGFLKHLNEGSLDAIDVTAGIRNHEPVGRGVGLAVRRTYDD